MKQEEPMQNNSYCKDESCQNGSCEYHKSKSGTFGKVETTAGLTHFFELVKIENKPNLATTGTICEEIAYVMCRECGEVKKVKIQY